MKENNEHLTPAPWSARTNSTGQALSPLRAEREKTKYPAAIARKMAEEIVAVLKSACEPDRCVIAGSLRRGKELVGDAEILFVPRVEMAPVRGDMFDAPQDLAARTIEELCELNWIERRRNVQGRTAWGELIKLARHTASGVPIDFFAATEENWWNYLVCRTGPAENNTAICMAAQRRGWKWEPYSSGFADLNDPARRAVMESERAVFEFVGMKYREPKDR